MGMGSSLQIGFLLYLGITSVQLISGFAWSDRLVGSNHFSPVLKRGAADSIEDSMHFLDEDEFSGLTGEARSNNARSEKVLSSKAREEDLAWNRALDMEDETELRELYSIQ